MKSDGGHVRVLPLDVAFDVRPGETVMHAAQRHGYYWPTVCGGEGECGVCRCRLTDGAEATLPPTQAEKNVLEQGQTGANRERLACRLRIDGPVTIEKVGIRRR
ncbi:2Fe-2S iron-sulfur cluster-binding protein [Caballeronia sp. LZ003]|uniref:2Fe-2S iron-sulfur cluster-binding protein n=1 Tax=unclassified Caballeronia TaxID=2646786 RepID=UPI003857EF1F